MARATKISKAKAATQSHTQRQTRSRAGFAHGVPLMKGLDHRGRPMEELPKTPKTMTYAAALELEMQHKKTRQASTNQKMQKEEERTETEVQRDVPGGQQGLEKNTPVEDQDTSSRHRESPPGYVPDSPGVPTASDVLIIGDSDQGDNNDNNGITIDEDKEKTDPAKSDGPPTTAPIQPPSGRLTTARQQPALTPLQPHAFEDGRYIDEELLASTKQHQSQSLSADAKAIIDAYETFLAETFPLGNVAPFPAKVAKMLDDYIENGMPANCPCDCPGLCDECWNDWKEIADFRSEWAARTINFKRKRSSDDSVVDYPRKAPKRSPFVDTSSDSDETPSVGVVENLDTHLPHADSADTETVEISPPTPASQLQADDPRTSPTNIPFNNSSGDSIVRNPYDPCTEPHQSDGVEEPSLDEEYSASLVSRPGHGMNIYFLPGKPAEYNPEHDRQDPYDPTRPQPIDVKPAAKEYQPDHGDDEEEYDPTATQGFIGAGGSPEYQIIGLGKLSPIAPDINCVGCRLQHANTGQTDTPCFDCKFQTNRRFSGDDRHNWKKVCIADTVSDGPRVTEVACTTTENPRVLDLEGRDAGCWDARYHTEEEMPAQIPFEDEEDHTDWEGDEDDY